MKVKMLIFLLFFSLPIQVSGQINHFTSVHVAADADVGMGKLANIDDRAGYGLSLSASFCSRHKLQLLFTSGVKSFFGNKVYIMANEGRENKNADIYTLTSGPQYFISRRIALSVAAGPAWHAVGTRIFSRNVVYELTTTVLWNKHRRLVTQMFFAEIPRPVRDIRYAGVRLGYRIF